MNDELFSAAEKVLDSENPLETLNNLYPKDSEEYKFLIETFVINDNLPQQTISKSLSHFLRNC